MDNHLSPTEIARRSGMERREVISACLALGVPIFHGRVDSILFEATLAQALQVAGASHYTLFDSAGNMIESFASAHAALDALRELDDHDRGHVRMIAFDAEGNVVGPTPPTRVSSRV
jgi:hypothetical protein